MSKQTRKSLYKKLDTVFSKLIRERSDWICEACKIDYKHEPGYLDCSHYIGRGNHHIRFDPMNASAHCKKCHLNFTHRYWEHEKWFLDTFGQGHIDILRDKWITMQNKGYKRSIGDLEDMLKYFNETLDSMLLLRKNGKRGYIDFKGWD